MILLRIAPFLAGSAVAAALVVGLCVQLLFAGTPGDPVALLLASPGLTVSTAPIAAAVVAASILLRRRGVPRAVVLLLDLPAGVAAGVGVAVVAGSGLEAPGAAIGFVTAACCIAGQWPVFRRTEHLR
jgi:hypothetical protein